MFSQERKSWDASMLVRHALTHIPDKYGTDPYGEYFVGILDSESGDKSWHEGCIHRDFHRWKIDRDAYSIGYSQWDDDTGNLVEMADYPNTMDDIAGFKEHADIIFNNYQFRIRFVVSGGHPSHLDTVVRDVLHVLKPDDWHNHRPQIVFILPNTSGHREWLLHRAISLQQMDDRVGFVLIHPEDGTPHTVKFGDDQ